MERKNFKKLKTRFSLRLCSCGFRKYVLMKLFQRVTFMQRNKLLNTEPSLLNVCQPLTVQKAERRIFQEGKASFAHSQEDEETSAPPGFTPQHNPHQQQYNHPKKHGGNEPPARDFFN